MFFNKVEVFNIWVFGTIYGVVFHWLWVFMSSFEGLLLFFPVFPGFVLDSTKILRDFFF